MKISKAAISILLLLVVGISVIFLIIPKLEEKEHNKISDQNIPPDYILIKRDVQRGIFYDLNNLTKDYYLRADFYPSYSNSSESSHDYSRWGIEGYGAYPGEESFTIQNFTEGQYINVYTFVKAGENVETFQGIKFNVEDDTKLFDIKINPDIVMFTPTFPYRKEYTVDNRVYDWAYKMNITITAKENIPSGTYKFKLDTTIPDENTQKFYYEDVRRVNLSWYDCPKNDIKCDKNIVELRKKVYVNGGQFQADKLFTIIIVVK
jgi:hypothetical protein